MKLRTTIQPWIAQSAFQEFLDDNLYELGVIRPYRSATPEHEGLELFEGSMASLEGAMIFTFKHDE